MPVPRPAKSPLSPRPRVHIRLLVLAVVVLAMSLACRPRRLGEGPPKRGRDAKVLETFDPSAEAEPNPDGLDLGAVPQVERDPPALRSHGPTAEAGLDAKIRLRFNRPMVRFGAGPGPTADPDVFSIDPPVSGRSYWDQPHVLVFEPEAQLAPATIYEVRVDARLPCVGGPDLDVDHRWSFTTTRPSVNMRVADRPQRRVDERLEYHRHAVVELEASQPLERAALAEAVEAVAFDDTGHAQPVDVVVVERAASQADEDSSSRFEIRPRTHWPSQREIVVSVAAQLVGKLGPASIGDPVSFGFRTVPGVMVDGRVCTEATYEDGCELGPVALALSSPIDAGQARHVSVSPRPRNFEVVPTDRVDADVEGRTRPGYRTVVVWGRFEQGVEYELRVDPKLRDLFGQSLAPADGHREALRFVEPEPTLEVRVGDSPRSTLDLAAGATIGVETRHVAALDVTVAVLSEREHEGLGQLDGPGFPARFDAVIHEQIPLTPGNHGWSSHALDLSRFTDGKPGVVAYRIGPASLTTRGQGRKQPGDQLGVVQLTRLGVTVLAAVPGGVVRVARLADDSPVVGATVELIDAPGGERRSLGETDAHGHATLPSSAHFGEHALVRVRAGDDQLLLAIDELDDPYWHPNPPLRPDESVQTKVVPDRWLYVPGERLRVLGWAAISTPYELSGLRPLPPKTEVVLRLRDPDRELVATRTVTAKDHGKFWASFELSPNATLGHYTVEASIFGHVDVTHFEVHDTQLRDFELHARAATTQLGPGEAPSIQLTASYLFGGRVPIVGGRHSTTCSETDYTPPKLPEEFRYGVASPVQGQDPEQDQDTPTFRAGPITPGPGADQGRLSYTLGPAPRTGKPLRCTHSVAVADASAREVGAELEFQVLPSVFLAATDYIELEPGDDAVVELLAIDLDGAPTSLDGVELRLVRDPWTDHARRGRACRARIVDGAGSCRFRALERGEYHAEVRATIDGLEVISYTSIDVEAPEPESESPPPPVQIRVAGPHSARVGQTIDVDIATRWQAGRALLVMGKSGIHELRELSLDGGRARTRFAIDDAWIPRVEFGVLAIEARPGSTPALHWDSTRLPVGADTRVLSVELEVPSEAGTGERVPIFVRARDVAGRPVSGHVAIWAIDEALLALDPYHPPSVVPTFADENPVWRTLDLASGYEALIAAHVSRSDPYSPRVFDPGWTDSVVGVGNNGLIGRGSLGGNAKVSPEPPIEVRSEFASVPFFIADVALDADGRARVEGRLPDNLTTFRVLAVVTSPAASTEVEARSGSAEAKIEVSRPLVTRALVPRALRPGDHAELAVLVDNLEGPAGTIEVEVKASGGVVKLVGAARARAAIDVGGQVRVPFAITSEHGGEGTFEARVRLLTSNGRVAASDAVRVPLPVRPERTLTERVAVYGELDDETAVALLPLALPADADPAHGGLSVSITKTMLGGLEDAVAYLSDYPHAGAEQTASRLVPLVELSALERADLPEIPDPDEQVAAAVARLRAMQLDSGALASWPGGSRASPTSTAYASWVLQRAKAAGFAIPDRLLGGTREYLDLYLHYWLMRRAPALRLDIDAAIMLWSGAGPSSALAVLYERRARLPVFARAMLLSAILRRDRSGRRDERIDALLAELRATVVSQGPRAQVVSEGEPWTRYWDSDTRTAALVLLALLEHDPRDELVVPLVRGLLDARRGGRWTNTQENALALAALSSYAAQREPTTAASYAAQRRAERRRLEARIWLGQRALARIDRASVLLDARFRSYREGRESDPPVGPDTFTPMAELQTAAGASNHTELVIERAGVGTLYYRVGLEWASTSVDLPARDAGLRVARQLRSASGPVGAGEVVPVGTILALDVRVEIEATVDDLAIEVPIAAGLEPIDLELGQGRAAMKVSGETGDWVSHQQLRSDRVILYADRLEPGTYETTAFVRATTPGEYQMPAATAEMMYYPEIYGRTTSRKLTIR